MSAGDRSHLWLYGVEAVLHPAPARPSQSGFSLPSVLDRLEAQRTPLSEGARTLRDALASAGTAGAGRAEPPTVAELAAAFAAGCRVPETPGGAEMKLKCEGARTDGGSEAPGPVTMDIESVVERCVSGMEEKLWRRIGPRLESIERKQDVILERLDKLSLGLERGDRC